MVRSAKRVWVASSLAVLSGAAGVLVACLGEDPAATGPDTTEADSGAVQTPPEAGPAPVVDASPTPEADAGVDAGPTTYCATLARPDAGDFFCADFDEPDASGSFTKVTVPDGGTLQTVTDIFYSPPASVTLRGGSSLWWEIAGPKTFKQIDARVRVNVGALGGVTPASSGSIALLEARSIDSTVSVRYTRGGYVESGAYTGYYLQASSCPNACMLTQKRITGGPTTNAWTEVVLSWASDGTTKVTFDGVTAFSGAGVPSTSTKIGVQLGLEDVGDTPAVGRHAFDDLQVWVQRN